MITEAEAVEQGYEQIPTNKSKYKFVGTKVYSNGDNEIAFYTDDVLRLYPHLRQHHGNT